MLSLSIPSSKGPLVKHNPHPMWCDVWVWASALQPHTHTITHSHTLTITCTCCYDETKGTQDQDQFSCSFSVSLSDLSDCASCLFHCAVCSTDASNSSSALLDLCAPVYVAQNVTTLNVTSGNYTCSGHGACNSNNGKCYCKGQTAFMRVRMRQQCADRE